jgi:hypothetical protein
MCQQAFHETFAREETQLCHRGQLFALIATRRGSVRVDVRAKDHLGIRVGRD